MAFPKGHNPKGDQPAAGKEEVKSGKAKGKK